MRRQVMILILTLIFALMLCGAVSATDTSNATASDNLTVNANQSSNIGTNNSQILPDPRVIRGGTVVYSTTTIQDAIDHAIDGDTIEVEAGTYNENVGVTKRLNITATGTATVTSFTITSAGSGSIIQGFTINNPSNAGIILNPGANNCQILRNVISGSLVAIYVYGNNNIISNNTMNGVASPTGWSETVFLANSVGNTISKNIITSTATGTGAAYGIRLNSGANHNTVSENKITATCTPTGQAYGIEIGDSDNTISGNIITVISTSPSAYGIRIIFGLSGNIITGNSIEARYGVYSLSPDNQVNFNRIISNYAITLVNPGTLDARYNWYGSNADPSSNISHYAGAIVNYDPWLVLNVTASPTTVYNSGTSNITADFTHDSAGGIHDPASGHFPDGIPVTFTTTLGTIGSQSLTVNGIAQSTLKGGSGGNAEVSAELDGGTANTLVTLIDTVKPTAKANIKGGLYNSNKAITLSMSEPGKIYYTKNGSTPTTASAQYKDPIVITATTTLKFMAVDLSGNPSTIYTEKYTIDKTPPKVISTYPKNKATGVSRTKTIYIKFSENLKKTINWPKIYIKNLHTGKKVSITKWISGKTLYIKMSSKRYAYNWYQVYIPAYAVKDSIGNRLAKSYTFRFKTGR